MLFAFACLGLVGAGEPHPTVTRVHVKKSARTMELLSGDSVVASYAVAVGKGGAGPKKMEGDSVTPVGRYQVREAPAVAPPHLPPASTTRTPTTARASRS